MPHQAQLVVAAASGHRTFLLADEPGLGKTAQALLAAQAANAYPLLVVVPNVVKTNWAREVGLWTPNRSATVIHGNGDTIDGFADIVIVNYEVLDRHVGWLGDLGFRGMVVEEAHFITNKTSQRSQVRGRPRHRRRKIDVAADIAARRIADLPVELDEKASRSIQEAERDLARPRAPTWPNEGRFRGFNGLPCGKQMALARAAEMCL
jgi:hypothetical protein